MSSAFMSLVWSKSRACGSKKLVLLALADHADRNGEVELSLREMAALSGLSKTRVEEIIQSLIDLGELRIRKAGSGRGNPTRYWITLRTAPANCPETDKACATPEKSPVVAGPDVKLAPEKPFSTVQTSKPAQVNSPAWPNPQTLGTFRAITQADVDALLDAAGISVPDDQPFYWSRKEHRDDLTALVALYERSVEDLCADVRAAIAKGKTFQRHPRRLTNISDILGERPQ